MGTASTQIPEKGTTILVSQENSIFEPLQGYEEIHIQEGFIGVTTCLTHSAGTDAGLPHLGARVFISDFP